MNDKLKEVQSGVWLSPGDVVFIAAKNTDTFKNGKSILIPGVVLTASDQSLFWEFDSIEDARKFARSLAESINAHAGADFDEPEPKS